MTNKNDNYLISREAGKSDVAVWRLDLESEGMLQRIETDPAAKLDPDRNLTPIGSYLLEWGQSLDFKTSMVYRLWRFDPSNANPLGSSPVQEMML